MTYILNPKNKEQERMLEDFLKRLSIRFYSDEKEDAAILRAMERGRKSKLLTATERSAFLRQLKAEK